MQKNTIHTVKNQTIPTGMIEWRDTRIRKDNIL